VIGDVRSQSLWTAPSPELYVPIEQWGWRGGTVFLRTTAGLQSADARVRKIVRALDPLIPALNVRPIRRARAPLDGTRALPRDSRRHARCPRALVVRVRHLWPRRVGRRRPHARNRYSDGPGRSSTRVRLHVLANALRLGATGIALGAVLAYGSAHYLRAFVAGNVRTRDPLMLAATMLILLIVTAAAAWLPARRASRVDPLLAIRAE
jgi:putative ABC transport system permease protein